MMHRSARRNVVRVRASSSAKTSHRTRCDNTCEHFRRGPVSLPGEDGGARMQAYLARRLLALIPALFFASVIVFVIVRLVPGSIIDMMLAQNDVGADKLSRDQLIGALGPAQPMWRQYFTWIGGILLHADFGRSLWQNTPVRELLGARMPVTFELGLLAMIVALLTAIPIGIYSAIRQDTAGDYLTRSF